MTLAECRELRVALQKFLGELTAGRWRRRRKDRKWTLSWEPLPKPRALALRGLVAKDWARQTSMKNAPRVALESHYRFDDEGRAQFENPAFGSVHSAIAATLADLLGPDARVEVRECPRTGCRRFYMRRKRRGQPRIGCTNACSVAIRKERSSKSKKGRS